MIPNQTQLREAHMRTVLLGLILNLLLPIVLVVVAYFVRKIMAEGNGAPIMDPETLRILFYAFTAVAVSEIVVVVVLKKQMLDPLRETSQHGENAPDPTFVLSRYVILYAVALSCAIYGFVLYMLGGAFEEMVLLAVISLMIFRFVRPSQEYFYSLFGVRPAGTE